MKHIAIAFAVLAAAPALAQTPARDRFLIGNWVCSVTNTSVPFDHVDMQFDSGGVMLMKFFNADPNVKMTFTLTGLWTYDATADTFGEKVTGARIGDIVAYGKPMPRSEYPGGEVELAKLEQGFMDEYSKSPMYFTKVTASELVIKDTEDAVISCKH